VQPTGQGQTSDIASNSSLCEAYVQPEYFKTLLLRPVKNGSGAAGKLLQALVAQILLRRTKESKDAGGNRLVELPPIEYFQASVRLDEETREMYDEIQRASAEALLTGQVGTVHLWYSALTLQSTANVLSMLTRSKAF
jgi:SWI/SNF-related matrix-associated actin-dependent regulator of chromatin subfamily A3